MKPEINKFTPYTNCPSGEYWAAFCNSEVQKYPRGKREIISFLILNEDKKTPRQSNKEEAYSSLVSIAFFILLTLLFGLDPLL